MQNGGRETQSTEVVVTPTEESRDPGAVDSSQTAAATETGSGATTRTLTVTAESMRQLFTRARLRSRFTWQRLRTQRRKAAAAVVLIVIAMVWFDAGSSQTGTQSNSPGEVDRDDTLLSDSEPVDDDQAMRESSDPFETLSQDATESGLYFSQTDGSAQSDTVSQQHVSANHGDSTRTTTTRNPDTASAFNANATQTSAGFGFAPQQPRKVKFAGRIQPAN